MQESGGTDAVVRFGVFEADRKTGELRKSGVRIRIQDQPFQILLMLLDRPGEVVTREEIQRRLWPDGTFVEFEHSIGTAVKKLRQALGDDADTPRYIETLPRRGFRFIAPLDPAAHEVPPPAQAKPRRLPLAAIIVCTVVIGAAAVSIYLLRPRVLVPPQRSLTRLTFDPGLQFGATWSPDGRYIAYSSDRGGKFDIWVQQVGGINPVKITTRPGHNWQPDWSPDASQIVFRSEGEGGGLFVVPALGGPGRKIASFGYRPRWSPDGSQVLFGNTFVSWINKLYVVGLNGEPAREILTDFLKKSRISVRSVAWYPGTNRLSIWCESVEGAWGIWTVSQDGTQAFEYGVSAKVVVQLGQLKNHENAHFRWGPSGRAVYFEGELNGVRNIWKMTADPSRKRFVALERLTTGPGPDSDVAVSEDGKRLVYSARSERVRVWCYPFDASAGRLTGNGQALTPPGLNAWQADISSDGKKLVYVVQRATKRELWTKLLPDGRESLLIPGESVLVGPRWSPDAKHIAFTAQTGVGLQIFSLPESGGSTAALTAGSSLTTFLDWLPDGESIVSLRIAEVQPGVTENSVLQLPLFAAPNAESRARLITSSRSELIDEIRVSPNARWLAFEGIRGGDHPGGANNAVLNVVAMSGGTWIPITEGSSWDDKPRWSPDGKLIYFVSSRNGFPNVWAMRFHPEQGRPLGPPFPVTSFESPALMVADLGMNSLSLSNTGLVLSMAETAGSIWALDDVDK